MSATDHRKPGDSCPTCHRTYGVHVDRPDRCGLCLTGISLDGRPVHPVQGPDGAWINPVTGDEALLLPDGTFTLWLPQLWPTREAQIETTMRRRRWSGS